MLAEESSSPVSTDLTSAFADEIAAGGIFVDNGPLGFGSGPPRLAVKYCNMDMTPRGNLINRSKNQKEIVTGKNSYKQKFAQNLMLRRWGFAILKSSHKKCAIRY